MRRAPTSFSTTAAADVRRHFALTQAELARWLGVTAPMVAAVEAGRRGFSAAAQARLGRLTARLPPAGPPLPAPAALLAPPPTAAQAARGARETTALRRRARRCRHLAAQLAFELDTWALQDAALLRRRQGLAALATALAAPPPDPDPQADPAAEAAWLARLQADTAAAPPRPGPLARAHHALRQRQLLAEAVALEAWLAE